MKLKTFASVIITLLIIAAVGIYLIALDNRYKQIYGHDYFDIRSGKTVKGEGSDSREVVVKYPLLNTEYQVKTDADSTSSR
jgi:hypothetical protein